MSKRTFVVIVCGTLLLLSQAMAQQTTTRRLLLSWDKSEFLNVEGTRLRLQHRYVLGEEPNLWLEAERPSGMALEANKTVGTDPDAGEGRYVTYVDRLDYVIDVKAAGSYQSWTRCFFPMAASWNHTEGMEPGGKRVVDDIRPTDSDKAGKWIWLKGPVYDLKPGTVTYTIDGYHGGAKLDRILLTRDSNFVPQGLGEPPSPNIAAHRTGYAETRELRLGPVLKWLRLENLPPQGAVAKISFDSGATWHTVPADGSLEAFPTDPAFPAKVRVRVELTRDDRFEPILEDLRLIYQPGEQKSWTLQNKSVRITFDPITGSLLAIENLSGPKPLSYLAPGEQLPLFNIFVQKPEKLDTLAPISSLDGEVTGQVSANGRKLQMDFALLGGTLHALVTCALDESSLTRWNLRLVNKSTAKVFAAQFPLLNNVVVGDKPEDDVMILPWWGAGSRTENPASAEWSAFRKLLNYPGSGSMQWLDLYDPNAGLYVAAYDPVCRDLELGYTQNRGQSVNLTFKKSFLLAPGREWSCDYAIGVHGGGDCHWAADRYREWAYTWQKRPPTPAWVADTDGWMMPDGANLITYPGLPVAYRLKSKLLGMNWMQCWMQMTESEHCCGQFHYPSPLWGTPEDFRLACQAVHDAGGRVGFYINAQLYKPWHNNQATNIGAIPTEFIPKDVIAPYDPQWAFRWQAKDFAGKPYDQPSSSPFDDGVRMNPASSGWQNHLIHWAADWYVDGLGTDCIYFDQLSASGSLPVYDDAQTDYGMWGRGYEQMLSRLLAKIRPKHPGFVMSMEGASELHGQEVATALYGTGGDLFDIYHYTFPDHILIDFGAFVNQFSKDFPGQRATYLNTFLMGTRFCEYPPDDFGRALFALRQRLQSLTFRATYRDTVGVETSDPAVRVKRFTRDDANCRAVLINLGNLGKQPATIRADLAPLSTVSAAWLFGIDGSVQKLQYTREGDTAAFDAPALQAATAVFVERTGPIIEKLDFRSSLPTGSTARGNVVVRNLSDKPINGSVSAIVPKGWSSKPVPFANLSPGEAANLAISIEIPRNATRELHDLSVVAKGAGGEDSRYLGLAVTPPVAITRTIVRDDGVDAEFTNISTRPIECKVSLDLPAAAVAGAQPSANVLKLKPGESATANFESRWPDWTAARLPQTVRVYAESEGLKTGIPLRVGPEVINGSFDMALINADKPEGWSIFGNGPECVHVVSDRPFEGKACLRVDPGPASPNVDQIVTLQPNTTYRLSATMRREDPKGSPTVWVAVREGPGKSAQTRLELPSSDTTAGEWKTVSATFTTPPEIMYTFLYACNAGRTGPIWIDDVKIEKVKQ